MDGRKSRVVFVVYLRLLSAFAHFVIKLTNFQAPTSLIDEANNTVIIQERKKV